MTWDNVHALNAGHVRDNDALDRVAPNSLYGGAPLTCQFMLEDHAVRHGFRHLARIRAALEHGAGIAMAR